MIFYWRDALISMLKCTCEADDHPDKLLRFHIVKSLKLLIIVLIVLSIGIWLRPFILMYNICDQQINDNDWARSMQAYKMLRGLMRSARVGSRLYPTTLRGKYL